MAKLLTKAEWLEILPKLKYILSDCDGVLWNGDRPIDGAQEAFAKLRQKGKQICYVTNNSTKTREAQLQKCLKLNFEAKIHEVYGTAYATAAHLKHLGVTSVYLIGNPAVHQEITSFGIKCSGLGADSMDGNWNTWLNVKLDDGIEAVVVAFDEHFSMAKVCRAASYLLNTKCHFIATNEDQSLPSERKDIVIPGTGCVLRCVETAAGRSPTIVGKPYPPLVDLLKKQFPELNSDNTLFIGDRLNTDIELGRKHGFRSLLVETGVHNRKDIDSDKAPTYFVPSLKDVYAYMDD